MKKKDRVGLTFDERIGLYWKELDQNNYPYARFKQTNISLEKKKQEDREKIVDKVKFVSCAMDVMITRQRLLNHNRFRIAAILDDITKYREVDGDNVTHCGEFEYYDVEFFYGRPMEGKVKLLIHYI